MMDGMYMGMMVLWVLVGLAVLALIVAGVVWLAGRSAPEASHPPESAEEILKRRYAAGEIDDEEFQRRRAGLQ